MSQTFQYSVIFLGEEGNIVEIGGRILQTAYRKKLMKYLILCLFISISQSKRKNNIKMTVQQLEREIKELKEEIVKKHN